jgi:hypothetical protein
VARIVLLAYNRVNLALDALGARPALGPRYQPWRLLLVRAGAVAAESGEKSVQTVACSQDQAGHALLALAPEALFSEHPDFHFSVGVHHGPPDDTTQQRLEGFHAEGCAAPLHLSSAWA